MPSFTRFSGGVPAPTDGDVKILPGGKVKKKEAAAITITRTQRNKRKFVTTVAGLDAFGMSLHLYFQKPTLFVA